MRIENEILMHFRAKKKTAQDVFFGDPIDSDGEGNSITLGDIMSDDTNVFEVIEDKIRAEELYKVLNSALNKRERQIINMRFGLDGNGGLTQREVSEFLNISRSYVSRIEKKAILKLGAVLKKRL